MCTNTWEATGTINGMTDFRYIHIHTHTWVHAFADRLVTLRTFLVRIFSKQVLTQIRKKLTSSRILIALLAFSVDSAQVHLFSCLQPQVSLTTDLPNSSRSLCVSASISNFSVISNGVPTVGNSLMFNLYEEIGKI